MMGCTADGHSRCTLWHGGTLWHTKRTQSAAPLSGAPRELRFEVRAQYSSSRLGGVLPLDQAYKERCQRLPFLSVMGVAVAKEY